MFNIKDFKPQTILCANHFITYIVGGECKNCKLQKFIDEKISDEKLKKEAFTILKKDLEEIENHIKQK